MKKVIIITGATSGVGEECAKRFANTLDWQVIGLARNVKKLEMLHEECGENFLGFKCDLTDYKNVVSVFKMISKRVNRLDICVNNAATFKSKRFVDCKIQDIDNIIDTNLKGMMYVTHETLKFIMGLKQKAGSRIINIGSVASLNGIAYQSIYCASKYGMNGFAEALNQEIIENNISISTIFPGGINTPLWNHKNPYPGEEIDKALDPSDIVDLIMYISELKSKVILKNMTLFPSNEWH